jgi:hypothetical protein
MILRFIGLFTALVLLAATGTQAATLQVPSDYATIQAAIDASASHDTVLVAPGTYYENIIYHGHNIVVASNYLFDHNTATINATIINGSQPASADTGTVVRIVQGEDSTAQLVGFTITGGTGTPLRDQNNHLVYIEAGGVMVDGASPVVAHNHIVNNQAVRTAPGISSTGGGGIRVGFGNPQIVNNVIRNNVGRFYGGGVVVNYATALLRNNVICNNSGGQTYGGGGLWIYGSWDSATTVENNTIVNNNSAANGGGVYISSTGANLRNNIIWGNHAHTTGPQIDRSSAFGTTTYCDVEGGFGGTGNINVYPQFDDANLRLQPGSPCIDAGDPALIYEDPDDSRNDMGAYGGPYVDALAPFSAPLLQLPTLTVNFGHGTPGTPVPSAILLTNAGTGGLTMDSARLAGSSGGAVSIVSVPVHLAPFRQDTLRLSWSPVDTLPMADTLLLYTNDPAANPVHLVLVGNVVASVAAESPALPAAFELQQNFPNPFNPSTEIRFSLPRSSQVTLRVYDLLGREVATLVQGPLPAGMHEVTLDASSLPSGIYFYRLNAGNLAQIRKMMLLK